MLIGEWRGHDNRVRPNSPTGCHPSGPGTAPDSMSKSASPAGLAASAQERSTRITPWGLVAMQGHTPKTYRAVSCALMYSQS